MNISAHILCLTFLSHLNGFRFEVFDPVVEISNAYEAALQANPNGKALIVTDFNGVLYDRPKGERATLNSAIPIQELLQGVTRNPRNHVYVVSAKHPNDLNLLLGSVRNLGLSAEHNMAFKERDAERFEYEVPPEVVENALDKADRLISKCYTFLSVIHK
ncbi:hypothetical protein O181_025495 [Austropuccinia psidii MF-1]|uniref:Uncharacterized protein n=1 Tax=Austropuccinia psidii MF-1 TaxID=1389203 RepID=A0A9Q3CMK4_9BASI|nr:hypothetical protein [Austropuccinia psidii MF-1]